MADLKLGTDGDLDITNAAMSIVRDDDALVQNCLMRLRLVKGEWFLDGRVGLPYFQKIFVKNPDLTAIGTLFRKAILQQAGIDSITKFDLILDKVTRKLSLTFTAQKSDGTTLVFKEMLI